MKYFVIIAAIIGGAAVGAGSVYYLERASIAELRSRIGEQADELARDKGNASLLQSLNEQLASAKQAAASAERAAAAALEERRNLEARLADLTKKLAASEEALTAQRTLATMRQDQPVPPNPSEQAKAGASPADIAAVQEAALRQKMQQRYGALIQKLGLSPADADRFLGLMVSRRRAADDLTAAALAQNDSSINNAGDFATMVAADRRDIETDLRSLLGDTGYAQFQQYETAAGVSGTVTRLQSALAATTPLTDAQAQQLQQILDTNHVGHLNARVIADVQAQGFLSPAQLQAMQALFAQQRAAQVQRRLPTVSPGTH